MGSAGLLGLVLVAGLGGAFLFRALGFPGGAILGSLTAAYLTASLVTTPIELPRAAVVGAQIAIGVIVASSVTGSVWARIRSRYRSSLLLAVAIIGIGLSFGIVLSRISGAPLAVMLMGTIPGGASDVSAIVIDLDEAFAVSAIFQILRQAAVFLTIGIVLNRWQRGRTA
jgi:membrane AbrB-like protein